MAALDPLTAGAVLLATAATDAVYVMFTSAVVARKRVPAATWSSVWYLLSSYAVISYTENWVYVAFVAVGSWIGAFLTITYLHRPPGGPPVGAARRRRDNSRSLSGTRWNHRSRRYLPSMWKRLGCPSWPGFRSRGSQHPCRGHGCAAKELC